MRIGIFTLPIYWNYGGTIQAYALQQILKTMGHEVFVLKHQPVSPPQRFPKEGRLWIYLKRFIKKYLLRQEIEVFDDINRIRRFSHEIQENQKFLNNYMIVRDFDIYNAEDKNAYDCFVVGSDQVWRPRYAVPIENYYLKFLDGKSSVRRIAYAASFGTADWEYTETQTEVCSKLAQQFGLITVREDSGVALCEKYLGVKATHVLDPTMLLDQEDYLQIIMKENIPSYNGNLFSYLLDDSSQKQAFVKQVGQKLQLKPFTIIPSKKELDRGVNCPSSAGWLRGFLDAEFVITDSFHGCVFSIIFNKPFIAIGNKARGQARFDSLLRMFHLQDRLVDIDDLSIDCLSHPIDWPAVNTIRQKMQQMSISLLFNSLK